MSRTNKLRRGKYIVKRRIFSHLAVFILLSYSVGVLAEEADSAPSNTVTGEWEGFLSCNNQRVRQGKHVREVVALTIESGKEGRYQAVVERFEEVPIKGSVEIASFVGEQRSNSQFRFVPDKKRRHTLGAIEVSLSDLPEKLSGKSLDTPCTFEATRIASDSPSKVIRVAAPSNGGSYFAANTPREQCNAIIAWTRRFTDEYPAIDVRHTVLGELYPKAVMLFADEEFVPVFGQTFEDIPYENRKSVWGDIQKNCVRDPLVRPDMNVYSIISSAFSTRPDGGGSFTPRAIVRQIRDTRATRYAIAAIANPKLESDSTIDYTTKQLEHLSEDLKKEIHILWPSERKLALEQIASSSNMNASAEAEKNLQFIADITDQKSQLEEINKVLPLANTPYGAHLSSDALNGLIGRLESLRQVATLSLMEPIVARLQSVPNNDAGLAEIKSLKEESEEILVLAGPETRKEYDDLLEAKHVSALDAVVGENLRQLADFPLDVQGLRQSAEWYEQFTSRYEAYKNEDGYKKALDAFQTDRKRRLEAALPDFTEQVKDANSSSEKAKLLASYLNWPGDDKLPIVLEYQLLAE